VFEINETRNQLTPTNIETHQVNCANHYTQQNKIWFRILNIEWIKNI